MYAVVLLFMAATAALTDGRENGVQKEIVHLLHYIENSDCIFIRNGREGTAADARNHIQKKYEYFKDRVKTTEDFIRYAATKSSLSGTPYRVRCNGRETGTAEWLRSELQRHRSSTLMGPEVK
jgi:hypothetical protein